MGTIKRVLQQFIDNKEYNKAIDDTWSIVRCPVIYHWIDIQAQVDGCFIRRRIHDYEDIHEVIYEMSSRFDIRLPIGIMK